MPKEQRLHQLAFPLFEDPAETPIRTQSNERDLHEALAPYLNVRRLRRLASQHGELSDALRTNNVPADIHALLDTLAVILRPTSREPITNPADVAALLMVEMGHLTQEQLRIVCLNTKNCVQTIHLLYQGSLNSTAVRIAEFFREPLRLNSAAIILAHNHPSADPTPSADDIVVTRHVIEAGKLLEIEVLDHLIIGQGRWLSMREKGLGFST